MIWVLAALQALLRGAGVDAAFGAAGASIGAVNYSDSAGASGVSGAPNLLCGKELFHRQATLPGGTAFLR